MVAIPKSATAEHVLENRRALDFELDADDLGKLAAAPGQDAARSALRLAADRSFSPGVDRQCFGRGKHAFELGPLCRFEKSMSSVALVDGVGGAAALCSMASFIPQLIKVVRERDASGVSLQMYAITVTGFTLWAVYGAFLKSWPLMASNLVSLALSALILVTKLRLDRNEKPRRAKPVKEPSS